MVRYNTESFMQGNVYQQFAVPKDFVDLANGEDPSKLFDLLHMVGTRYKINTSSNNQTLIFSNMDSH